MPRSTVKATPQLEIQLEDDRAVWTGADVITGRVSRCAPVVAHQATISICLLGRAKCKMVVNRGQGGRSVYRNRHNFFAPETTRVELLSGPIHIAKDGGMHSWPFSVHVPSQLEPAAVASDNQQKFSYLPLGHDEVLSQPMPPSFYARGTAQLHIEYEAYNEYFLQAEITTESGKSVKTETATLPINVLARSTPNTISEFNPSRFSSPCTLTSHRLLPRAEKSSLTLQQRTQQFFRSTKVPQFSFSLQVDCPRVLQIGSSTPIPFKLLALQEPSRTTDALHDDPPELTLTAFQLEVRSETEIICPGTLTYHDVTGHRKIRLLNDDSLAKLESPVVVPSSPKAEAVDVGQALGLTLARSGPNLRSESHSTLAQSLYPTLNTYSIRHRHKLLWKIEVSAAGVTTRLAKEVDLTLLPLLASSDAPPYTPFKGLPENPVPYEDESIPTYDQAVPSSSKTAGAVPEKAKQKE